MASSERDEQIEYLHRVFGNGAITKDVIAAVLDQNKGSIDAAVDLLLNMTHDVTGRGNVASPSASKPLSDEERQREENLRTIQAMFGEDLTKSVISVVYAQNAGDVAQAIDTLLNIHEDSEALEAIRKMAGPQLKKMEQDMLAEQLRRNAEREDQMRREIEEEKQRLIDLERRAAAEDQRRQRERLDLVERMKRQREEEHKEKERLEQQRRELELVRAEAERKLKEQEAEAKLKVQAEQEASSQRELAARLEERKKAVDALKQLEEQRKAHEEREAKVIRDLKQQLEERKKAEEAHHAAGAVAAKAVEEKKAALAGKEFLMSRYVQEAALVTLGVRYSARTIIVSWMAGKDLKPQPTDWIGFYKVGNPNTEYREYIKTQGERSGLHHFTAPKTPGLYVFKYFVGGSYNEVASSDVLHLGPQVQLSAKIVPTADPTSTARATIEVSYTLNSGELTTSDWVALYPSSEKNNRKYLQTQYVKPLSVPMPESGPKPPSVTEKLVFEAPRTPGDYVLRFFPQRCKYTNVAASNNLRIENRDNILVTPVKDEKTNRLVTLQVAAQIHSVEPSSSDYIALYRLGATNNAYITYAYYDRKKPFVTLPAPVEIDSYEVRFHAASQSKYADVCRSDPIHVLNTDWVKADVAGGLVTVTWDIHSQPKSGWDWVGLFPVGTTNTKYLAYKYIDVNTNSTFFEVPTQHGEYEVRYFSAALGKYVDFRKTKIFVVA